MFIHCKRRKEVLVEDGTPKGGEALRIGLVVEITQQRVKALRNKSLGAVGRVLKLFLGRSTVVLHARSHSIYAIKAEAYPASTRTVLKSSNSQRQAESESGKEGAFKRMSRWMLKMKQILPLRPWVYNVLRF